MTDRSSIPPSHDQDFADTVPIGQGVSDPPSSPETPGPSVGLPLVFPLLVAAVHFLIVSLSAVVAYRYGESTASSPPFKNQLGEPVEVSGPLANVVEPLRHWDGLWYTLVANEGYDFHEANAAFWPLFPMFMRSLSDLTGLQPEITGYLISNISFVIALILLYQLIGFEFGELIARRSLWILALFPTALFFSAVYTESLFLMLAAGTLLAGRRSHWWLAGILGLLAATTRSYGVFLGLPLAVLFFQQYGFYLRAFIPNGFAVGLPALGPLLFGAHLERSQGNWRQFIDVQSMWNRTFAWPWETMECAVNGCQLTLTQYGRTREWTVEGADWSWLDQLIRDPRWSLVTSEAFRKTAADSDTLELVLTIAFLAIAGAGLLLLPPYLSAFTLPGLLIPLFSPSTVHPLMSMPRFGIVLFPLFVVLALLLRWRIIRYPYLAASTVLLILLTAQFANWYWVS